MENNSNNLSKNTSLLLTAAFSRTDGVVWCSAFAVVSFFIISGNLLAITVFALNKKLRRKSFFLVINMAFADLMLGALSLPLFIYQLGGDFKLWTLEWNFFLGMFYRVVDTVCAQSSIITAAFIAGERFYAIGWPLKHRSFARRRAYYTLIVLVWIFSIAISAAIISSLYQSVNVSIHIWVVYAGALTVIICGCYIGISIKYKQGGDLMRIQNRGMTQNKRSTKTLLLITLVVLLSWLPLIITNTISVYIPVNHDIFLFVNLLNFCNSFSNPVIYSLRIPEFRRALFSSTRYIGKPSVSRLAATSTAVQLKVTLKHNVDLRAFLQEKEYREEMDETETELRA